MPLLLLSSKPTWAQVPTNLLPAPVTASVNRNGIDTVNQCFRDKHDCEAALKKSDSSDHSLVIIVGVAAAIAGFFIGKTVN